MVVEGLPFSKSKGNNMLKNNDINIDIFNVPIPFATNLCTLETKSV